MGSRVKRVSAIKNLHGVKRILLGIMLVAVTTSVIELAWRAGMGGWLEDWYYDAWHQLSGLRYDAEHVVLVVVDDTTRLEHRDEPLVFWGPHFARAIEVAKWAGAKVVAVNYLFSVSAESWLKRLRLPESTESRTFDSALREQLASGQVILAANMISDDHGRTQVILPPMDYWGVLPGALDDVGLVNFYNDRDGFIRRFVPLLSDSDGEGWVTMAQLLAERAAGLKPVSGSSSLQLIGYVGPPGSIPRISLSRLLAPQAKADHAILGLKDKVVIIASEFSGQSDKVFTPYSRPFVWANSRMMTGAEVHANIIESLLSNRIPRPASSTVRVFCLMAVLAVGTVLFFRLPPAQGLIACLLMATCVTVPAFLLFRYFLIFTVAGIQVGLALTYLGVLALRVVLGDRERTRIGQVFGRYVSEGVLEKLLNARRLPDLGGEALQITVLFADIRDFTTISEALRPHEVVEMLNTYFGRVCEPILNQGGSIDKFIGDAVMAVFGSPAPHRDHAIRAVRAALSITALTNEFSFWMKERFAGRQLPDFRVGIGLHTGEAVVGNIGTPKRMEFTSIGDAVNTASRLEGMTKDLMWAIIASETAVREAGPEVITGRSKEIQVKGRKKAITVYEVLGLGPENEGRI
jgi:adenylate cyclase